MVEAVFESHAEFFQPSDMYTQEAFNETYDQITTRVFDLNQDSCIFPLGDCMNHSDRGLNLWTVEYRHIPEMHVDTLVTEEDYEHYLIKYKTSPPDDQ